jgi:hypothetical protein
VPPACQDVSELPVDSSPLPLQSSFRAPRLTSKTRLQSVVYGFTASLLFNESEVVSTQCAAAEVIHSRQRPLSTGVRHKRLKSAFDPKWQQVLAHDVQSSQFVALRPLNCTSRLDAAVRQGSGAQWPQTSIHQAQAANLSC